MSLLPDFSGGYYDDNGEWQRLKYCFVQCQHCTCMPPGGLFYSAAHDTRKGAPPVLIGMDLASGPDSTVYACREHLAKPHPACPTCAEVARLAQPQEPKP